MSVELDNSIFKAGFQQPTFLSVQTNENGDVKIAWAMKYKMTLVS